MAGMAKTFSVIQIGVEITDTGLRMRCRAPEDRSTLHSYPMGSIIGRKVSRRDVDFKKTMTVLSKAMFGIGRILVM